MPKVKKVVKKGRTPQEVHDKSERYTDSRTHQVKYKTEKDILDMMKELLHEVEKDPAIFTVTQMLTKRGIPRRSYYYWVNERFPSAQEGHDNILSILGDRMVGHVVKDPKTVHHLMPYYDPFVWGKMLEYHNNMKKELQNMMEKIEFLVTKFPNKIEVPEKPKDEHSNQNTSQ